MAKAKNKKEIPAEEIKEEVVEKPKREYHGGLRGFKTLDQAINYANSDAFKKLDVGCQTEYSNWLKNILEEEK